MAQRRRSTTQSRGGNMKAPPDARRFLSPPQELPIGHVLEILEVAQKVLFDLREQIETDSPINGAFAVDYLTSLARDFKRIMAAQKVLLIVEGGVVQYIHAAQATDVYII